MERGRVEGEGLPSARASAWSGTFNIGSVIELRPIVVVGEGSRVVCQGDDWGGGQGGEEGLGRGGRQPRRVTVGFINLTYQHHFVVLLRVLHFRARVCKYPGTVLPMRHTHMPGKRAHLPATFGGRRREIRHQCVRCFDCSSARSLLPMNVQRLARRREQAQLSQIDHSVYLLRF